MFTALLLGIPGCVGGLFLGGDENVEILLAFAAIGVVFFCLAGVAAVWERWD